VAEGAVGSAATGAGTFDRDTAVHLQHADAGRSSFAATVADGWQAGRGPHGGYLAAMLLRALTLALADASRSPRSLTIHFLKAPAPGPVLIDTVLERAGRSLSSMSARMEQDGAPVALALGAFSKAWTGPEISELRMPDVEPPAPDRPAGTLIAPEHGGPSFAKHITLQHRFGELPFAQPGSTMETGGWIGLAQPRALDALSLAFFADALIPTPFMHLHDFAPAPTIDITIHFRTALAPRPAAGRPAGDPSQLVLAHGRALLVHEGFFEEDCLIWDADGTLLAQSRQLALLLG